MIGPGPINKATGTDQLAEILHILSNKDALASKLQKFEKTREEANQAVTRLTKAKDLDAALTDAHAKQESADRALTEAARKASQIINDANETVEQALNKAKDKINTLQSKADALSADIRDKIQELNKLNNEAEETKRNSEHIMSEAKKAKDEAESLKMHYEDQIAKIRAVAGF